MKKLAVLFLLLLLLSTSIAFAVDPVTIAVAADGNSPSSQVSAVAARCPYFLLFDEKGTLVEAVANPNKDAAGGAGAHAVDFLADKGVTAIIAGAFGQKMIGAMQSKGMRSLEFKGGTVEAVKLILEQ